MYRNVQSTLEVFLVHPGGPFYARKNLNIWTVPKGEFNDNEHPLEAAQREFLEETGFLPSAPFHTLGQIKQAGGKVVTAWAFAGDCDPAKLVSNTCQIEWPPRSGRKLEIPEIDRGAWFTIEQAAQHIKSTQAPFLDRLIAILEPEH